jgi:hypothetical protein
MKIAEMYKSSSSRIEFEDMDNPILKNELTITKVETIGTKRLGILLSFEETHLQMRCVKSDIFAIAGMYELSDTDDFVGKKIKLITNDNKVIVEGAKIAQTITKKEPIKQTKKKK